jgi:beta-mannosidase
MSAGLIPDPYLGDNEKALQWIGEVDWQYACTFTADAEALEHDRADLVFDGLDTVAAIELNGKRVGQSQNMHHAHRFDAKNALQKGRNQLTVTFRSAVRYARRMMAELGELPHVRYEYDLPYNFIRKNACNFGWDWGPTLVTCGIWQGARVEAWSTVRIAGVRPLVEMAGHNAKVNVQIDLEWSSETHGLHAEAYLPRPETGGHVVEAAESPIPANQLDATLVIDLPNPHLWWPRGYGDQPLYDLQVVLVTETESERRIYSEWAGSIGIRTVELDTAPDEFGSRFVIKVNGRPIFCKGANWIPDDVFLPRAGEPKRLRLRIQQAAEANMNMLRVWGGGIFESEAFYNICDELGILVWQDFLFACASYAEEEPFRTLVEEEARANITRLARHPSLVIWNGCNENLWGYWAWGWAEHKRCEGRTWGPGYYLDLLPKLCGELDPSRPYWPASPFSGEWNEVEVGKPMTDDAPVRTWDTVNRCFGPVIKHERPGDIVATGVLPNDQHHGNKHVWEAWFGEEYSVYRRLKPRFCSEFGFQGPANWATMRRTIGEDQLAIDSPMMQQHQKSRNGDSHNARHLLSYFDQPDNFDDWHYLMQLNQARALTTGIEWFRSQQPLCMGTLFWQINDCWPVTSWAAIDGDGRFKPLWYATRRIYQPRLLTWQPDGEHLAVYALNDTDEQWTANLAIQRMDFIGRPQYAGRAPLEVPPRSVQKVELGESPKLIAPSDKAREVMVATADGMNAFWFFHIDKHLHYESPDFEAELKREGQLYQLTITPHMLMRDVVINIDRLDPDGAVSDNLVTLMPEEPYTFALAANAKLSKDDLIAPPVLQCANRFGRKG